MNTTSTHLERASQVRLLTCVGIIISTWVAVYLMPHITDSKVAIAIILMVLPCSTAFIGYRRIQVHTKRFYAELDRKLGRDTPTLPEKKRIHEYL